MLSTQAAVELELLIETIVRDLHVGDDLSRLRALAHLARAIELWIEAAGREGVAAGATYRDLGRAAGCSKQRAHQRFGPARSAAELRRLERCTVLQAKADDGDRTAGEQLVELLVGSGRIDDLRRRADGGDAAAAERFAEFLVGSGRIDDLRRRADGGDAAGAERFAEFLVQSGRIDDLRRRADGGDAAAAERLAKFLVAVNQIDELRTRADKPDQAAAWWLDDMLARSGDVVELKIRSRAGDGEAARRLAGVLAERGETKEAIEILREGSALDDKASKSLLAELLTAGD